MSKLAVCCALSALCVFSVRAQSNPPATPPQQDQSQQPTPAPQQNPPAQPAAQPAQQSQAPAPASPARSADEKQFSTDQFRWQLGFGYQYQRFGIGSVSANEKFGTNTEISYFKDQNFAFEGAFTTGFSRNSPVPLDYHTFIFAGGGKYTFWRKGRWEPWVHGLVGGAHIRHSQTVVGAPSGNGVAFIGGGGVDFPLWLRFGARVETDFVGTRTFGSFQKSVAISGGVVIYF